MSGTAEHLPVITACMLPLPCADKSCPHHCQQFALVKRSMHGMHMPVQLALHTTDRI